MPIFTDFTNPTKRAEQIVERVQELFHLNTISNTNRSKIRDIMNGGPAGIARLVGRELNENLSDMIPVANQILKAVDRMGQKIGPRPDIKVDPTSDAERAVEYAGKRARILESLDRASGLELQLPQSGRWLPGYGFVPWVIKQGLDRNSDPFPLLELRDPFNAYPGPWTISQQPDDIAFRHVIPVKLLEEMFPEAMARRGKAGTSSALDYLPRERGGVVLGSAATIPVHSPSWSNQAGAGVEVYEYHDKFGSWWVLADGPVLLHYTPNLLARPAFVVAKRYSFDALQGQYDQLVGLISGQARLNMLSIAAAELAVNSETAVIGDMVAGKYIRGRGAINYLAPGSTVTKVNERIPLEVFSQIDRIERQIRSMATYPVTDDAISPNSFVTEVGLTELKGSVEDEYREYRLIKGYTLELADEKRLEWLDTYYPDATLSMSGVREGAAFAETYRPGTHINGQYVSRRVYGAMAGMDEPNKIIVGSVLQDKGVWDTDTFRENIDGLGSHDRIKERIHTERIEGVLLELMSAGVQALDPRVIQLVIEEMPEGSRKELFREMFEQEEEPAGPEQSTAPGAVPDVTTVLNRLTTGGGATAGVQTVGRS